MSIEDLHEVLSTCSSLFHIFLNISKSLQQLFLKIIIKNPTENILNIDARRNPKPKISSTLTHEVF